MSKILASIAALERDADVDEQEGFHGAARELRECATAARAEHAEIVAMLTEARDVIWYDHHGDELGFRLDTLLSRIAPERAG